MRIKLQSQPFKVLTALLERPGQIVTREQLQDRLWGRDTVVDFDHSLGTAILGGMIVSTFLNLAIIPALYLIVARFDHRHEPPQERTRRGLTASDVPGALAVEK